MDEPVIIPLSRAALCVNCTAVSNSRGDHCLSCGSAGSLLSLARVLDPTPELGAITYISVSNC